MRPPAGGRQYIYWYPSIRPPIRLFIVGAAEGVLVWRRLCRYGGRDGRRGGFINRKDMYNNDVGKGGVRVYEGHEVK